MPILDLGKVTGGVGPAGPRGRGYVMRGMWTPAQTYICDESTIDVVEDNGSAWFCKLTHTAGEIGPTGDSEHWGLFVRRGDKGADGVNGTNGKDGRNGVDGTNGRDGNNGTDGRDGTNGKDGASLYVDGALVKKIFFSVSGTTLTITTEG